VKNLRRPKEAPPSAGNPRITTQMAEVFLRFFSHIAISEGDLPA